MRSILCSAMCSIFLFLNSSEASAVGVISFGLKTPDVDCSRIELLPADGYRPITFALTGYVSSRAGETKEVSFEGKKVVWECERGIITPSTDSTTANYIPPSTPGTDCLSVSVKVPLSEHEYRIMHKKQLIILIPERGSHLKNGKLNGFEIGEYPDPLGVAGNADGIPSHVQRYPGRFQRPRYFYQVTRKTRDLKISPHYTLGDFAMDYPWYTLGMPQYIALDYRIVQKLEMLHERMNADMNFKRFSFVYGFRPPSYNLKSIAEDGEASLKQPFSQHQYGRAVDIIIDRDGDNVMDDLNGDGKLNMQDAAMIMHYVNILDRELRAEENMGLVGGAGLYDHTDFWQHKQTPYVHMDVRGFLNLKGYLIRWPARWPGGDYIRWDNI